MVSVGGSIERIAGDLADVTGQLSALVDGQGERWRARTGERESSTYAAGVLHGLCIALAVVVGGDSDVLLHEQMSGQAPRPRAVGEVRVVHAGANRVAGGRFVVERWTGEKWEPVP